MIALQIVKKEKRLINGQKETNNKRVIQKVDK